MSIQELEAAITRLSKEELATFSQWFEEYIANEWDRQIEADAHSGRLSEVYQRLKSEDQGKPVVPLDEFLDHEKLS